MSQTTRRGRKSLSGEPRATESTPDSTHRHPFETDVDQHRLIECYCAHCKLTETVLAEPGRRDEWTHAQRHPDHMTIYELEASR